MHAHTEPQTDGWTDRRGSWNCYLDLEVLVFKATFHAWCCKLCYCQESLYTLSTKWNQYNLRGLGSISGVTEVVRLKCMSNTMFQSFNKVNPILHGV